MALPTGTISLSQVNVELGRSATQSINLNEADVRGLAEKSSGAISMDDLRGKSTAPDALGDFFQGGYYIGDVSVSGTTYGILLAPKASGQSSSALQWKTSQTATSGTTSSVDGWTNTNNMNNSSHPAAQYTRGLSISGFSDWYLPARDELNLAWVNRATLPAGETNDAAPYWSSSERSSTEAWPQFFVDGSQLGTFKTSLNSVRAVRRFVI